MRRGEKKMKLKSLLVSTGLSLVLSVCFFAGFSIGKNKNFQEASAYSKMGLVQVTRDNCASLVGKKAYVIGASDFNHGIVESSGAFGSSSNILEFTIGTGSGGSMIRLKRVSDGQYLKSPLNGSYMMSSANFYLDNSNYFSVDNSDPYCCFYNEDTDAIFYNLSTHAPANGYVITKFFVYAEPDPVYKTFYFDYTAVPGWSSGAITKLETSDGLQFATEVAYSDSNVLKATVNVAAITSVKFVRLNAADLSVVWNETPEQPVFNYNYCNVYDNSGYSYGWTIAKSVKVLDISGTTGLFNTSHYAHIWDSNSSDAAQTTWRGRIMNQVGSSKFYEITFKNNFDKIIFNNDSGQTANLDVDDGKVWVLQNNWNGAWVSEAAAEFINTYLKFDSIDVDNVAQGTACKTNWNDLYTAYTTTYASEHTDIISVPYVKARLVAWAEANGASLDLENGALSVSNSLATISRINNDGSIIVIITMSLLILLSIGGFFFVRNRKKLNKFF